MSKEKQQIMVVKRDELFSSLFFEGFIVAEKFDFYSKIIKHGFFHQRGVAEKDENLKQPICYVVIIDENKEIFLYRRSTAPEKYTERRLYGRFSIGIGGHVDNCDKNNKDPLWASLKREISEEIVVNGDILSLSLIGYVNCEKESVEKVHFGIVFVQQIRGSVKIEGTEISDSWMMSAEKIKEKTQHKDFVLENWSKYILEGHFIKDYK